MCFVSLNIGLRQDQEIWPHCETTRLAVILQVLGIFLDWSSVNLLFLLHSENNSKNQHDCDSWSSQCTFLTGIDTNAMLRHEK